MLSDPGERTLEYANAVPNPTRPLVNLNGTDLDTLYSSCEPGTPPTGAADGLLLLFPGNLFSPILRLLGRLIWQGKQFNSDGSRLLNYVTVFRFKTVPAQVYRAESWFDGKPSTILDYSKTSVVARLFRDEIQEVSPGIYLGHAFVAGRRWFRFALYAKPSGPHDRQQ